jgi:CubicO group peptidase (beta-lactamase class C family)
MKLIRHKKSIALYFLSFFWMSVFFWSYDSASANTYPTDAWTISTPEEQGLRSELLVEMMAHIRERSYHIDSILIVRNGKLVFDAYFWPFSKNQKHIIHSCTKSVMSALIGIAIDKGYIQNVDQPITEFFPDKAVADFDGLKKTITLKNLLTMSSGLKCRDSYLYRWSGLFEMRYSPDWAQYVLDLPMAEAPGEKFEYCNGVSYLLSVIIQNKTKMRTLDFARKHLFDPLGITDIRWAQSPQGVDVGYGEMWLTPHDMARFGWLYLNKGRWENQQIVPSAWVEASTRGHMPATIFHRYGYQWWIDSAGYYAAVGYKGQRIFVVPKKNMVAVFTGDLTGRDSLVSKKLLDTYIIPAASSANSLPLSPAEQARLDALINGAATAPAKGYTWAAEDEGAAKDGVFIRTAPPGFMFEYPPGSKKSAIIAHGQIMRMKTPGDFHFSASIHDIPEGLKLEDFGPDGYAPKLNSVGSNIRVISNEEIRLQCGTRAYRTDITWTWNNSLPITTLLVSAYKDGKIIFVCAHPWKDHYRAEPIVQSLTFK